MKNSKNINETKIQYRDTDGSYYKPATANETVKIFFVLVFAYAVVVGSIVGMAVGWIPVK
jgi:hypothetical protein